MKVRILFEIRLFNRSILRLVIFGVKSRVICGEDDWGYRGFWMMIDVYYGFKGGDRDICVRYFLI